jgi:hypothetical protein
MQETGGSKINKNYTNIFPCWFYLSSFLLLASGWGF